MFLRMFFSRQHICYKIITKENWQTAYEFDILAVASYGWTDSHIIFCFISSCGVVLATKIERKKKKWLCFCNFSCPEDAVIMSLSFMYA